MVWSCKCFPAGLCQVPHYYNQNFAKGSGLLAESMRHQMGVLRQAVPEVYEVKRFEGCVIMSEA